MIELKHLSKIYDAGTPAAVTALEDISLTIRDGEIFGIIGLSGAGKSTLVRCINLLERPTEGSVVIDGTAMETLNAAQLRERRRDITMIFQQFNLLMQRSCLKNICFPMELAGVKKADAEKRARELLEVVGLPDKANAYPAQLSGGQKQRVAIAGIIAMQTGCIVLDEPTAMLDPRGRREVFDTVRRLNREMGITVLFVTHFMDEAVKADRVIIIDSGRLCLDGTPREVFSQTDVLRRCGLDVPQSTELCHRLIEKGIDLPGDILDADECVEALSKIMEVSR